MTEEQFTAIMDQLKLQTKAMELIIRQLTLVGWGVAIIVIVTILVALFK